MINQIINEKYNNEENALIVENYPYGYKRTKIRYWIESVKKKGDRFCSQTLNPKTNKWNKPKKSIYNAVMVLYKDEKDYIQYLGLYRSTSKEDYLNFIKKVGNYEFNDLQKEELKILRAYIKTYENVSFEIVNTTNQTKEEKEKREKEQKEIEESIKKQVILNYYKNGVLK